MILGGTRGEGLKP
uniref:Uncharacterized protein n=1 Tax=Arundo donax TaxID=35708 RepID=A0A0A9G147_ARUDO